MKLLADENLDQRIGSDVVAAGSIGRSRDTEIRWICESVASAIPEAVYDVSLESKFRCSP